MDVTHSPPPIFRVLSGDTITSQNSWNPGFNSYKGNTETGTRGDIKSYVSPAWCLQPYNAFNVTSQFDVPQNFTKDSSIDILEAGEDQQSWVTAASDVQIESCIKRNSISSPPAQHRLVAFFVSLVTEDDFPTTYGNRANLSLHSARDIIKSYGVSDAFLPNLIGRPDYWAPYVLHKEAEQTYEFHCQHPRWQSPKKWDQHRLVQRAPSSVYMKHFGSSNLTIYIAAAAPNDDCITFLRDHLCTPNDPDLGIQRLRAFVDGSPFLLHSSLSSVVVEQSKDFVHDVRKTLMTQINEVNDYGKPPSQRPTGRGTEKTKLGPTSRHVKDGNDSGKSGRAKLEAITKELHLVSQKADTGIANAEKAIENCEYILAESRAFHSSFSSPPIDPVLQSSLRYTLNVWQCQKRLLSSYKARKETSMNLVFNLVTQQDSAVNVAIASSMLEDSASMKTIAVLTMVFLPGAFLSAMFSSGIFQMNGKGGVDYSDLFMPFWYCLIPLTFAVIGMWATRGRLVRMGRWIRAVGSKRWAMVTSQVQIGDLEKV